MNSITPHITSTEEIINYPQVQEGAADVIGLPIISEVGPITPVIVNNRQFVKMFVNGDGIKKSDNISLKVAYILSKVSDIMVCRVSNTEVLPAVALRCKATTVGAETTYSLETTYLFYKDGKYYTENTCTTEYTGDAEVLVYSTDPNPTYQGLKFTPNVSAGTVQLSLSTGYGPDGTTLKWESYPFSLDLDAVDGYGNSLYAENINIMQSQYHIEVTKQVTDTSILTSVFTGTVNLWASASNLPYSLNINNNYIDGVMTNTTPASTTNEIDDWVAKAINKLLRYRRDVKMPILWDGGLVCTNKGTIVSMIDKVARKRRALGVFSTPLNCNTFSKLMAFGSSPWLHNLLNTNDKLSSYLYNLCPTRTDTTTFGFRQKLPYTLYYILAVLSNKSSNLEFAPVFGKKTGVVNGKGIDVVLYHSTDPEEIALEDNDPDLPETEALQRLSLNPVIYDESLDYGYAVNNLTYQTPNLNNMSEENNRRLFNSIQFDVNKLLDDMLAKANNSISREELSKMLDNYRTDVLAYLGYGLNKNTPDGNQGFTYDIEPYDPARRNTLKLSVDICFTDSIKYVNVVYRDVPVMVS